MKNGFKKLIAAFVLTLAFFATSAPAVYAEEEVVYPEEVWNEISGIKSQLGDLRDRLESTAKPKVYDPLIKLLSPQTITAEPGETIDVVLTVKNMGTSEASSVLTQATPANLISVLFVSSSNNAFAIGENMTHSMTMTVRVDASIEPGTYPINLTHYYKTKDQQNKTSEDQISVYVAGKPTSSEANVSLGAFRSNMESIAPGGTVTISAPIQNLGDGEATQVRVNYEPGDAADIILTSDPYYYSTMEAGYNDTVSFTFRASSDAERGTYPIRIKLSYKDEDNELHEETVNTSITVSKDQETGKEPNIEIRDLTAPSGVYKVGETSVFALRVINTGDGIAENVKITATPSDAAAVVPTSGNIQTIRAFNPGEERVINFSFAATEAAKTQSYAVGFNVEYYSGEDDGGEEKEPFKFEQYASVGVDNPEDDEEEGDKTSKPKMIVSRYAVNPQVVQAGREFDLDITFQNTSSVKAIENIKITLEALEVTEDKGSVFNPVGGSNTLFIDEMGIKEELTHNLKWYTVNDAEARSYKLQVRFQYQDEDLNDYEEIEQLAINVKQTTQIEVPDVYFPDTAMVGEEINIYTSIINTGKVRISNLRVRVDVAEGSEFDKRTDMYLSNVGTGNQVQYDGYITMTTPGLQSGTFVAYGEDDTGEPIEFALDFTIDVTDGGGMNGDFGRPSMDVMDPGMTDPGMMEEEPQGFFAQALAFIKLPYVWGTGIGVIAIVIVIIVVRVRRKKRTVDFDE